MAKEIRYWYKWEPLRFAKSPRVIRMSIGAKGAYRGILDSLWLNEGKLPNAPDVFWKYADCTPEEWEAIKAEVMPMLTASEDGKWLTNDTLSEVWEEAATVCIETSEKKKAAAKARWDKERAKQNDAGAMHDDADAMQNVNGDAQNRTEQNRTKELNPADLPSNQKPAEENRAESTQFNGIEVAQKFMSEFTLSGTTLRRDLEQAVTQRAGLREITPSEAMDEMIDEYHAYRASKPEFPKGVRTWLSECNQAIGKKPAQMKWKEIPEPIYTPAPVVNDPRRRPR